MTERLIIEGSAVYEIDEECLRRREAERQEREQREKEAEEEKRES